MLAAAAEDSAAAVADFQEAAIAAVPVHSRTPSGETGHTIRFPTPARSRKPLRSHKVAVTTLWLSNCEDQRSMEGTTHS